MRFINTVIARSDIHRHGQTKTNPQDLFQLAVPDDHFIEATIASSSRIDCTALRSVPKTELDLLRIAKDGLPDVEERTMPILLTNRRASNIVDRDLSTACGEELQRIQARAYVVFGTLGEDAESAQVGLSASRSAYIVEPARQLRLGYHRAAQDERVLPKLAQRRRVQVVADTNDWPSEYAALLLGRFLLRRRLNERANEVVDGGRGQAIAFVDDKAFGTIAMHRLIQHRILESSTKLLDGAIVRRVQLEYIESGMPSDNMSECRLAQSRRSAEQHDFVSVRRTRLGVNRSPIAGALGKLVALALRWRNDARRRLAAILRSDAPRAQPGEQASIDLLVR